MYAVYKYVYTFVGGAGGRGAERPPLRGPLTLLLLLLLLLPLLRQLLLIIIMIMMIIRTMMIIMTRMIILMILLLIIMMIILIMIMIILIIIIIMMMMILVIKIIIRIIIILIIILIMIIIVMMIIMMITTALVVSPRPLRGIMRRRGRREVFCVTSVLPAPCIMLALGFKPEGCRTYILKMRGRAYPKRGCEGPLDKSMQNMLRLRSRARLDLPPPAKKSRRSAAHFLVAGLSGRSRKWP